MASLAIDQNILVNYARPKLDQAKKCINQARSQAKGFNIPSSFYYRKYLQNLANNLLTIENNIGQVNTKINTGITNFNSIERKTTAKTSQISSLINNLNLTASVSSTGASVAKKVKSNTKAESLLAKVKSAGKDFVKMLKDTGAKVVNGAKSLWNDAKDWYKEQKEKVNDILESVGKTAAKVGSTISGWAKSAWSWISSTAAPAVWDVLKKTGSLIAVFVQSILSGLLQFVEAVVDLVGLVVLGIASIGTGLWDAGQAIHGKITGKEWNSVTKKMWNGSKGFIATTHVKNAFSSLNNTAYGRWLNENSFGDWARTDGIMAQIGEGIGYVAGVVILTIVTFGVGGAAVGATASISSGVTATTLAVTAGTVAVSKYTEEAWNNNKVTISDGNNNYDMSLTYDEVSKLKKGDVVTKEIEGIDENGNKTTTTVQLIQNSDGTYSALMNGQKLSANIDETGILEGLTYGGVNGLWEFAQWYIGGKIGGGSFKSIVGGIKSNILKKIATSGIRVVLDSATGAVEVPFRSLLDIGFSDMSWKEAWEKNGGWNGVLSQSLIASISSAGGEAFDFGKIKLKAARTKTSFSDMLKITELEEFIASNKIKYQKMYDNAPDSVKNAIDLSNTKQLSTSELEMYHKIKDFNMSYYDDEIKLEGLRRTIGKGNMGKYTYKVENPKLQKQFDKLFNEFDKETGEQLEKIFFQEDYVIGIHRSGGELGDTIVGDGLMLTGHASSAVDPNSYSLDLNNNISLINGKTDQDYYNFLLQMKKGYAYKSNGQADIIITAIPKNDINNLSKLVSSNNGKFTLKNDYILGYVNNNNGYFSEFKFNSDSINFKNNSNLNVSNANVMSSSEFKLKKLLEQYDSQTETILKYEKSGMYTPEQINNFKKSADKIKTEIDELTIEMNQKFESTIVENINESNNIFWFNEIDKANKLHAANDLRTTIITVNSLDEIPYDFIARVKNNDSLRIKIGDRFYKPNDVNLMIHNHISNMNSGIVNYTKQFDYWSKQLEIKKNEYSELYDIIKSDEYKMAMEYKNKGYAQDLSWLEYYESVEKKLNDTRSQLQSLFKTCEELDNLAYNERLVAKQAEIEALQDINKLDEFFSNFGSSKDKNYGVNQGVMQELYKYKVSDGINDSYYVSAKQYENNPSLYSNFKVQKEGSLEYFRIKDKLTDVYGFSPMDASRIISGLNSQGACSYAAMSNVIITRFKNHSDIFEQQFGYPLFTKINGKTQLNSAELIADLYVFANSVENGGKLFQNGKVLTIDNNLDWAGRTMMSAKDQMYMSTSTGANDAMMTLFLRSKGFDNAEFETSILANYSNREMSGHHVSSEPQEIEWIKEDISQKLSEGQSIGMGIYKNKMGEIRLIPDDGSSIISTNNWNEGDGHAVFVTGVSEDGIIVSSWGKRYTIPNRDLLDGSFMIRCSEIYQSN